MKLRLPEGIFKAYLFDCDGTIADSMPLHHKAWKQALGEWNREFEEKHFYAWGGMPVTESISTLNERDGLSMPVKTVSSRKERLDFNLLPELQAVPDVLEQIEAEHGRIPFAVVSGSTKKSAAAFSGFAEPARSIRHDGMRGRLCQEQARSGSAFAGGGQAGSRAGRLPGIRRHGHGKSGSDGGGGQGFGETSGAVGESFDLTGMTKSPTLEWFFFDDARPSFGRSCFAQDDR
jgi:hypothetical protein